MTQIARPPIYTDKKGPNGTMRYLMHIVATPAMSAAIPMVAQSMAFAQAIQGAELEYQLALPRHGNINDTFMAVASKPEHVLQNKTSLPHATFAHLLVTENAYYAIANSLNDQALAGNQIFDSANTFNLVADGTLMPHKVGGYGIRSKRLGTDDLQDIVPWIDVHAKGYQGPHDLVEAIVRSHEENGLKDQIEWVSGRKAIDKKPHFTLNVFNDDGQSNLKINGDVRELFATFNQTVPCQLAIGFSDGIGCNTSITGIMGKQGKIHFPRAILRNNI